LEALTEEVSTRFVFLRLILRAIIGRPRGQLSGIPQALFTFNKMGKFNLDKI